MDRLEEEYKKLKAERPDEVLLYQVGVFFRIMHEDARQVAGPLGLKLRVEGDADNPITLCGFPLSGLDKYVGKLVRAGYSVSVCVQKPAEGGGVRREVSETIRCSKT